jgi:hypothetical protein
VQFLPKLAAIRLQWHQKPQRRIESFLKPRGVLTKPGLANQDGSHRESYKDFPASALKARRR